MQFIKTLFWVILAVTLVIFAVNNWSPVSVLIWENLRVDTKLPVLVIGAFLIGFVPMWLLHRGSKWRSTRRIKTLEESNRPSPAPFSAPSASANQNPPLNLSPQQIAKPSPVALPGEPKATEL